MVNERKLEGEYYTLRRQLENAIEKLDNADKTMNELLNDDPEGYPAGLVSELIEMREHLNNWIGTIQIYEKYHSLRGRLIDDLGLKHTNEEEDNGYW